VMETSWCCDRSSKNLWWKTASPRFLLGFSSLGPLWYLFGTSESGVAMRYHRGSIEDYFQVLINFTSRSLLHEEIKG